MTARILSLVAAVALPSLASATTIYSDSFSGAAGPLNGQAPDVRPAGETWTATEQDYNYSGSGALAVGGPGWAAMATLPFAPEAGNKYLVSADITIANTATDSWTGIGFYADGSIWNSGAFVLDRGNAFMQPALNGFQDDAGADITGKLPVTNNVGIKLDTTGDLWSATLVVNGVDIAATTRTFAPNYAISSVGFTTCVVTTVDNFKLEAVGVPEPASLSLLGLGSLALLRRRRA